MIAFSITLFVALIGALIAMKLKVPAGAMVGALFAVALFNVFTDAAYVPSSVKIIAQISTGTFIGSRFTKNDLLGIKSLLKTGILLVVSLFIVNLCIAYFLYKFSNIDIITSLFSTAPGGMLDMTLISYEFGADTSTVAILQLIRLISVVLFIPILIKKILEHFPDKKKKNIDVDDENIKVIQVKADSKASSWNLISILKTLGIGFIFGMIGYKLGVPAGAINFSMIATGIYNIKTEKAFMPIKLRKAIQILAGALIGYKITYNDILSLKSIIGPVFIIIIGFIILNIILGTILYKNTDLDLSTAFFSAAPGGMSDMAIISGEFGANASQVVILQLIRLLSIISFYPLIIKLITTYIV